MREIVRTDDGSYDIILRMTSFLATAGAILVVILLFSFAVFIHEFGHFLAARLLGMKVDAFSIGFGPAIWKKKVNGIEYKVSWILFGGYVALPQLDPAGMEKIQGKNDGKKGESGGDEAADAGKQHEVVEDAPAWKRIVVAVAGPFGNIVLAVFLACLLAVVPWTHFGALGTEVGGVIPESPASRSGIVAGDTVVAIDSHPVETWYELLTEVQIVGDREVPFRVRAKDGVERDVMIKPLKSESTGVCLVGLQSVEGRRPGAYWMPDRSPVAQLKWDAMSIVRVLKALVTPKESGRVAKSIGGPILIAQSLYSQVREDVWDALGFLRFLCINLAILNLLPIPVLDGGHCMFALFEIVFRRKPRRAVVDAVTNVFGYLFIALFVWLIWSDTSRIWHAKHAQAEYEAEAAASAEPPENPVPKAE